MSVRTERATSERWDDLVQVFGRRGDDPSWCWCRRFLRSAPLSTTSGPHLDNRAALQHEIAEATTPPGLIAYVDERPVGWTRVGPRVDFPGVLGNRALVRVLPDDPDAWWVTCFAVAARQRRSGVGTALLEAAVELARENGATAVEGHPVDVHALRAERVSGSAVFTGTLAMFGALGFFEFARTYPSRPVMRLLL